ncbi:hypothetical protein DOTSEDRAFT_37313 [Dothistroma septosporum NZE10]|uniref:Uncharacterized protein n=1 Tax=Dothistroma septosporum (strain NZE10 / CBS 128990) TaxID=675120 RepID=N1PDN8_DOTSN|nr:hypothetical protein DOTSEDRAFT_37313 [Dothistroma septosporum NZE10]
MRSRRVQPILLLQHLRPFLVIPQRRTHTTRILNLHPKRGDQISVLKINMDYPDPLPVPIPIMHYDEDKGIKLQPRPVLVPILEMGVERGLQSRLPEECFGRGLYQVDLRAVVNVDDIFSFETGG